MRTIKAVMMPHLKKKKKISLYFEIKKVLSQTCVFSKENQKVSTSEAPVRWLKYTTWFD